MKPVKTTKKDKPLDDQPMMEKWDQLFKQTQANFEKKYVSDQEKALVSDIRAIMFALDDGPAKYGAKTNPNASKDKIAEFSTGFTEWDTEMLTSAQFKLSMLIQSLGRFKKTWQNRADHVYIYHKISFAQDFTRLKKQAQELIDAGDRKHRITDTEVESQITPRLFQLEEFKIMAAGRYMELESLEKSVGHILTSISQEKRDRGQEKRLPQNQN